VLKPGGRLLLVGEHWLRPMWVLRRFIAALVRQRRIVTDIHGLFPPDPVLGDHYYRRSDYYLFFRAMGYRAQHHAAETGHMLYIADKPGVSPS
jgi:hypothetical protein